MPLFLPFHLLQTHLASHFGLMSVGNIVFIEGGFQCVNFTCVSEGTRYFLKRYRVDSRTPIQDVKRAERYFAEADFPVILPIKDKQGESVFEIGGAWYSLFPFVDMKNVSAEDLTPRHVASLGLMQARLHRVGSKADLSTYPSIWFWSREKFLADVQRVEDTIHANALDVEELRLAFENLQLQAQFVRAAHHLPTDYGLKNDCLLHGDFIYTNVFFHENGDIKHVYDFELTRVGPRAYDLARSVFISCFDDGWDEKNFEFARIYLKAYQTVYPISKEEFSQGIQMYITHFMHMSWLEIAILIDRSTRHHALIRPANARLHQFLLHSDHIVDQLFVE